MLATLLRNDDGEIKVRDEALQSELLTSELVTPGSQKMQETLDPDTKTMSDPQTATSAHDGFRFADMHDLGRLVPKLGS